MPRSIRMIIPDEPTVYHVMSRSALRGFPLTDVEKDYLMNLIRQLSRIYFAEILGFCIMGNHFHLLVRMCLEKDITDAEVRARYQLCYGLDKTCGDGQIPTFRQKWTNLSEFIKEIKQTFTRFYNKRHGRYGFFWGGRFKSLIVEKGETLINCLAYIDLNPVRAGLVAKPEDYRWNSLGYHLQQKNKFDFLSLDFGMREFGSMTARERLRYYRRFVYETGAIDRGKGETIEPGLLEKERRKDYVITRTDRFRQRTRYFTDSGIIGTREFVKRQYQRINKIMRSPDKDKVPKPIKGLTGLYSLKRLGN